MRKNVLAVSIAAMIGGLGLAGGAHAGSFPGAAVATTATQLIVARDGIGHSLLVPYYTVQNGQATLINLINHDTNNGKAVKVRFRGASNSDDVFDFTLFLSPGDMWSANISQGADGRAFIKTADTSCTLPATVRTNGSTGTPFITDRLDSAASAVDKAAGTREGYVEIFAMADIPTGSAIYTATKHVNGIAPCTAGTFTPLATYTNIDTVAEVEALGFRVPTTGLSGTWTIIDVPGANAFSGNATAVVAANAAGVAATGRLTLFSQTAATVAAATAATWTADPLLAQGFVSAAQYDFPDMSTPYVNTVFPLTAADPALQAQELSDALAVRTVENEFYTDDIIAGATDWVFSMPTRRYSVAFDYTNSASRYTDLPVTDYFNSTNTGVTARQICVTGISVAYWNREEVSPVSSDDFVVSPGTPGAPLSFCGEASVLSINDTGNSVLSASVARKDINVGGFTEGWLKLSAQGASNAGLPILGSSFQKYVNPQAAAGVLGNYGTSYPHKVTR